MVIPESCRNVINRERINERCEPNLEGMSLKQQVQYMQRSCDYLVDVIVNLLYVVRKLEQQKSSQPPSGTPGA